MRAPFSGYGSGRAMRQAPIGLGARSVDEATPAGTVVGALTGPGPGWSFYLADTAGGRFALDGNRIVVGATPPNFAAMPRPTILVAASDGVSATAARLRIDVRRALPALPLPLGARLAAIGDSQTASNNYAGTPIPVTDRAVPSYAYGFIEQAVAIDPRVDFDSWYDTGDVMGRNLSGANQGFFGDHLDWPQPAFGGGILGRLPAVVARRPGLIFLQGGSNTLSTGDGGGGIPATSAYAIAKLEAALTLIRNAGIPAILGTIHPRGDWPAGDARYQALFEVNAWIRQQGSRSGILGICDPYALLAPGGVQDLVHFSADKIHLNQRGAWTVGRDHLLPILAGAVAAGMVFNPDPGVANLLGAAFAKFQGSGGAKLGNPAATGNVATGFQVQTTRNTAAILCSKEVVSGDIEAQVFDITPADTSAAAFGQMAVTLPPVAIAAPGVGKWYVTAVRVETSGPGALSSLRLVSLLRTAGNATNHVFSVTASTFSTDLATAIPGDRAYWLKSKPFQAPPGVVCDQLQWSIDVYYPKTGLPLRAKLSRLILREIPDPRPGWGY